MARLPRNEAVQKVVAFAAELGFTACRTKGDHIRFSKPGCRSVFFSSTPGDKRAHLNAMSSLRKADREAAVNEGA